MSPSKPLSFTQVQRYNTCGRNYYYHYIEKLREITVKSFLMLGSSIDTTLNFVLEDYKKNNKVTIDYKTIFDEAFSKVTINYVTHEASTCELIQYSKADWSAELLQEADLKFIKAKMKELQHDWFQEEMGDIQLLKNELDSRKNNESIEPFLEHDAKILNLINYLSLRRKCHLMLDAYVKEILPQIEEVRQVQYKIDMTSNNGDGFIGFVDTIVKFKGDKHYTVLDNKTASQAYAKDKVITSEQLSTYCYALGLGHGAYAVMIKKLKLTKSKKCVECGEVTTDKFKTCANEIDGDRCGGEFDITIIPEINVQLLKDAITLETQEHFIDVIGVTKDAINEGEYPQNLSSCQNIYGSACPYMGLCLYGQENSPNLVKLISAPKEETHESI